MVDSLSRSVNFDLVEKLGMGTNDISSARIRHCLSSAPLGMNAEGWAFALKRRSQKRKIRRRQYSKAEWLSSHAIRIKCGSE